MTPDEPDTWEAYMRRRIKRARLTQAITDEEYHELERRMMAAIFDEKILARVCCPVCNGDGRISIAPNHNS